MNNFKKIVIGTVQFGMDYGVSNQTGKTSLQEAIKISEMANSAGVNFYDTAPDYGESYSVMAEIIRSNPSANVISKIPAISKNGIDNVIDSIHHTVDLFGENLYGLLFHRPDDVLTEGYQCVLSELSRMKDQGLIRKVGASIYDARQLEVIHDYINLDLVQLPFNAFDHRFKYCEFTNINDFEIHSRSTFLQGLLLMENENIPFNLNEAKGPLDRLNKFSDQLGLGMYQLCLKWVMQQNWINRVLIGVNSTEQFQQLINSFDELNNFDELDLLSYKVDSQKIINPSMW